jgi:lysozyme family protein
MSTRFNSFVEQFVFPHEVVFKKGHHGDMNFVTWENVPGDGGGLTKYGIDQRSHPSTDIKNLTAEQAKEIYRLEYWVPSGAEAMPPGWGEALVDIRINGGDGPRMAQRALINLGYKLNVDGKIGPLTHAAMQKSGKAGIAEMLKLRDARYRRLAQKPALKKFLKGWLARNDDLRKHLGL